MTSACDIKNWHEAIHQFEKKNVDEALDLLDEIENPSAKIWYDIGMIYWSKKSYHEAMQAFTNSVEKDKYFALGYLQRAILHTLQDNLEESLHDLDQTVQCLRGNPFIDYKQLGMAYKMWSYEVLYDIAVIESRLSMNDEARAILESTHENTKDRQQKQFIQEALEKLQNGTLSSQSLCYPAETQIFKPPAYKTSQLNKRLDFLGKAKVIASVKIYDLPDSPSDQILQNPLLSTTKSSASGKLPSRPPPPSYKPPSKKNSTANAASKPPAPVRPSPLTQPSRTTDEANNAQTKQVPKRPPPPCLPTSGRTTTLSSNLNLAAKNSTDFGNTATISDSTSPGRPPPPSIPLPVRRTPRLPNANNTSEGNFSRLAIAPSPRDRGYIIVKVHCIYTRAFKVKKSINIDELKELIRNAFEPPPEQMISLWCKQNDVPVCIDNIDVYNQILGSDKVKEEGRLTIWCFGNKNGDG